MKELFDSIFLVKKRMLHEEETKCKESAVIVAKENGVMMILSGCLYGRLFSFAMAAYRSEKFGSICIFP